MEQNGDRSIQELLELARKGFRERGIVAPEQWLRAAVEKSEGDAGYLELVFRAYDKKRLSFERLPELPDGYVALCETLFARSLSVGAALDRNALFKLLSMTLTSVEPLSRGVLKYCLNFRFDSGFNSILRLLELFLTQTGATDSDLVYPVTPQIREAFLTPIFLDKYPISQAQALERFADGGLGLWRRGRLRWTTLATPEPNITERYFLERLPLCLLAIRETALAVQVLTDFAYLMKRVRFLSVERLIREYGRLSAELVPELVPEQGADAERLRAFADFFCRSASRFEGDSGSAPERLLLQLALEECPGSPVEQAAQTWLNPAFGPSPCDWFWVGASPDLETGEPSSAPRLNYGNRLGLNFEEAAKIQREKNRPMIFDDATRPIPVSFAPRPCLLVRVLRKLLTWKFFRLLLLTLLVWKFCQILLDRLPFLSL